MIRLLDREIIGKGVHRSGWPWCMNALVDLVSGDGILFDDFVERSFIYEPRAVPYREPWIGVFHHPPFIPNFVRSLPKYSLMDLASVGYCPAWRESQRYLVKAITFTEEAATFIGRWLRVPTYVVRHPTETCVQQWSPVNYGSNEYRKIVQVGMQLRNLRAIFQVPPLLVGKARMEPHGHHIRRDAELELYWRDKRVDFGGVEELVRLSDSDYDILLSCNLLFLELFGAVANNVVVEAIARCVPLVVNRLPAVVEYLGRGYPLFYDNILRVPDLLASGAVLEAFHYLCEMDKQWLDGGYFREAVREAVAER